LDLQGLPQAGVSGEPLMPQLPPAVPGDTWAFGMDGPDTEACLDVTEIFQTMSLTDKQRTTLLRWFLRASNCTCGVLIHIKGTHTHVVEITHLE